MKYAKLIGIGTATLGVVASVGVSFALYKKAADPKVINIGTVVDNTADVNYAIGTIEKKYTNAGGDQVGTALDAEHNVVTVKVPLSANPKQGKSIQPYVVGDCKITLSGEALNYVTPTAKATNYKANTAFTDQDFTDNKDNTLTCSNIVACTSSAPTEDENNPHPYVEIKLTYDITSQANMLAAAAKSLNVKVEWKDAANYEYAYVVGDETGWEISDQYKYRMVPNLYASSFQWWYTGYTASANGQIKAKIGDVWSANPNMDVTAGTPTNLWWSGSSSDAINDLNHQG